MSASYKMADNVLLNQNANRHRALSPKFQWYLRRVTHCHAADVYRHGKARCHDARTAVGSMSAYLIAMITRFDIQSKDFLIEARPSIAISLPLPLQSARQARRHAHFTVYF